MDTFYSAGMAIGRKSGRALCGSLAILGLTTALTGLMSTSARADSAAASCDPYKDFKCMDSYLGDGFFERIGNYYKLEMDQAGPPADPDAPAARRDYWPGTPETSPPMPFTEWPHGGTNPIGVTRPNSVDSPFMSAIANTSVGQWMANNNLQLYGWVDGGFNMSTNTTKPGGNAPAAYIYTPNTFEFDQAVLYLDRFADTVQTDHIDWGMRLSAIYGENYRYTTSYGMASYQLLKKNDVNGYDFPMLYGDLFIPFIGEGLNIRVGRYIAIPDTEAQLAPNNYMYTHSITYSFDNYTTTGLQLTQAVTKNLTVQASILTGTEAPLWHDGATMNNQFKATSDESNPFNTGAKMLKDPGAMPSFAGCIRYTTDSGNDTVYPCADGLNNGKWGYNNLQWYGTTYYHKFNDKWHITFESYDMQIKNVPNARNTQVQEIYADGGLFNSPQYMPFNGSNMAYCKTPGQLTCNTQSFGLVSYLNYSPDPLNNISFRPEFYDDMQGQRTGTRARYVDVGIGWQHWLSPQFEFRPELVYYRSIGGDAFNGNSNSGICDPASPTPSTCGTSSMVNGNKNQMTELSMDAILHF